MTCALEKIIMAEVSGHIRISYECGSSTCVNITAFARMLLSNRQIVLNKMRLPSFALDQWPPNMEKW